MITGREIKQYRESLGLTQRELAAELSQNIGAPVDAPSISRMENGVFIIPQNVESYIEAKIAPKALASPHDARKGNKWVIMPCGVEKSLKSPFSFTIWLMLKTTARCNPLSREYLSKSLGITDRQVRRCIEELRSAGVRVASSPNHFGYWICKTEDEYRAFRKEYMASAKKVFSNVAAMDGYTEGQMQWEEQHG